MVSQQLVPIDLFMAAMDKGLQFHLPGYPPIYIHDPWESPAMKWELMHVLTPYTTSLWSLVLTNIIPPQVMQA